MTDQSYGATSITQEDCRPGKDVHAIAAEVQREERVLLPRQRDLRVG